MSFEGVNVLVFFGNNCLCSDSSRLQLSDSYKLIYSDNTSFPDAFDCTSLLLSLLSGKNLSMVTEKKKSFLPSDISCIVYVNKCNFVNNWLSRCNALLFSGQYHSRVARVMLLWYRPTLVNIFTVLINDILYPRELSLIQNYELKSI